MDRALKCLGPISQSDWTHLFALADSRAQFTFLYTVTIQWSPVIFACFLPQWQTLAYFFFSMSWIRIRTERRDARRLHHFQRILRLFVLTSFRLSLVMSCASFITVPSKDSLCPVSCWSRTLPTTSVAATAGELLQQLRVRQATRQASRQAPNQPSLYRWRSPVRGSSPAKQQRPWAAEQAPFPWRKNRSVIGFYPETH